MSSAEPTWAEVFPLADLVVRAAALWPDAPALVFPEARWTYAELRDESLRAARSLRGLGIGPGDRVGVFMGNGPEFVRTTLGIARLGAVGVLVNARYQGDELGHVLHDAQLSAMVTCARDEDAGQLLPRLLAAVESLRSQGETWPVVVLGDRRPADTVDEVTFNALADEVEVAEVERLRQQVAVRDIAMMMYTSGTTALPKGCLLTHEMIVRNGAAVGRRLGVTREDRFWDPLPMFHMSSLLPMIGCFTVGARFCSMRHFDAGPALALMAAERATHAYPAFPTVAQALAHHPDFAGTDLSSVRVVNLVSPVETLRDVQHLWPQASLISAYGCTEVGGVISHGDPTEGLEERLTSCGAAFDGIGVRVVDPDTGDELGPGESGEIRVRGYSLFSGYHGAPELTAERLDAEGFFGTGDRGSLDAAGRIAYHGRLKDMLKVGGENVAAVEIEELIQKHPEVSIAQVISLPDQRLMEVPAAYVELVPGSALTAEELQAWLEGRIASFKRPRHLRIVAEWPMAATKIQKFRLREALCAELGISPG